MHIHKKRVTGRPLSFLIYMNAGVRGREEVDAPPAHLKQDKIEDKESEGIVIVLHLLPEVYI